MSALISYALYIGIGISAVTMAVSVGQPYIEQAQDTAAVQNQLRTLTGLSEQIDTVAQMARGTQTTHTLQINRGQLFLEDEAIVYELRTESGIISAGTRREIGSIALSANARASLTTTTYNGTECYKLENRHVESCIATKGTNTSFEQGQINDLLLYLHNKRQNTTITPELSVMLDKDPTTMEGRLRTTPLTEGDNIGTAHLAILTVPDSQPTYTVHIKLRSGSDFFQVNVE